MIYAKKTRMRKQIYCTLRNNTFHLKVEKYLQSQRSHTHAHALTFTKLVLFGRMILLQKIEL